MTRSVSVSLAAHASHVLRGHPCFFSHACDKRGLARKSRNVFHGASIYACTKSKLRGYTRPASSGGVPGALQTKIAVGVVSAPMRGLAHHTSVGRLGRVRFGRPVHLHICRGQCQFGWGVRRRACACLPSCTHIVGCSAQEGVSCRVACGLSMFAARGLVERAVGSRRYATRLHTATMRIMRGTCSKV